MSEKKQYGLLVDYKYFSGNHAAEIACKEEMGLPVDQWGIKEVQAGSMEYGPLDELQEKLANFDHPAVLFLL